MRTVRTRRTSKREKRPKVFSAMSATLVEQLPNTVSISLRGVRVHHLMPLLSSTVACSAGSACHSEAASGDMLSPVLAAMRVPIEYGRGTLRLSFGRHTTGAEIDKAAIHIVDSAVLLMQGKAFARVDDNKQPNSFIGILL